MTGVATNQLFAAAAAAAATSALLQIQPIDAFQPMRISPTGTMRPQLREPASAPLHQQASEEVSPQAQADQPQQSQEQPRKGITFLSPSFHVYIEDTDAYGVMYNANYLRAYERALHLVSTPPPSYVTSYYANNAPNEERDDSPVELLDGGALDHQGWVVLGVTDHKFKGSPPLGGEFVVSGELLERECRNGKENEDEDHDGEESGSSSSCLETWKLEMKSPLGEEPNIVYNTATVTIASPGKDGRIPSHYHPQAQPFDATSGGSTVRSTYTPYRDEMDPALPHHMPLRNVLKLFERSRSDYLGGPDALRKMEAKDNIVWVVTSVDEGELCNLGEAEWDESDAQDNDKEDRQRVQCVPGNDVIVKTYFEPRRGGMVLECKHTLLVPAWDDTTSSYRNRRLAQASTTIMALDAKKRRPTRKIPDWFAEKINAVH